MEVPELQIEVNKGSDLIPGGNVRLSEELYELLSDSGPNMWHLSGVYRTGSRYSLIGFCLEAIPAERDIKGDPRKDILPSEDMELRKWCILTITTNLSETVPVEEVVKSAKTLYDWIAHDRESQD